jgi:hypothetical protein
MESRTDHLCKFVAKGNAHIESPKLFLRKMLDKAGMVHAHAFAI